MVFALTSGTPTISPELCSYSVNATDNMQSGYSGTFNVDQGTQRTTEDTGEEMTIIDHMRRLARIGGK